MGKTTRIFSVFNSARSAKILVGILLLAFLVINLLSFRQNTLTYDEAAHFQYGMQILELNSKRFDDSKMPFSALNALPAKLTGLLSPTANLSQEEQIYMGRVVTILISALFALFVFSWGRALYGFLPGLCALFLYSFEANIIAHSQLVTTDIYAMGMVLLSTYMLWRYVHKPDMQRALVFAIVLGLSQLAKYSSVFLYPLLALTLLLHDAPRVAWMLRARDRQSLWNYTRRTLLLFGVVLVVSVLIINIGFLFDNTLTRLGDYQFRSSLFQTAQGRLDVLSEFPIPLPYPYIEGLDWIVYNERTGTNLGRIYLLGRLSETGFPGYYFYAFLYKVPIAIQILILLSIFFYIQKRDYRKFIENELFLFVPVVFFAVYFNFFYRAQIGIRYFLLVSPFLLVFTSSLVRAWHSMSVMVKGLFIALSAYLAISVISYHPYYIPYFNELVPDRRLAYQILADSNLDWGQAGKAVQQYLDRHPQAHVDPQKPESGKVLVSANNLVGITAKPETYAWLRENYLPADTVAYAYLVFEIPAAEITDPP
ncbi:MAG TPA: glycosyltransferase family 39 protein [Anaerolineales bacterium]|nr:glycosyltransferase family 39 protein [Anaerolineales bacterium]